MIEPSVISYSDVFSVYLIFAGMLLVISALVLFVPLLWKLVKILVKKLLKKIRWGSEDAIY